MHPNNLICKGDALLALFFIPLSVKCEDHWGFSNVYGPYDDDMAVKKAIGERWPDRKNQEFIVLSGEILKVQLPLKEKPAYEKDGDGWKCEECKTPLRVARVAHPLLIRNDPGSPREFRYADIPYCPNCEKQPDPHGVPEYAN